MSTDQCPSGVAGRGSEEEPFPHGRNEREEKEEKSHVQPALRSGLAGAGRREVGWPWLEAGGLWKPLLSGRAGRQKQHLVLLSHVQSLIQACGERPAHRPSPTPPWASVSSSGRGRGWTKALLGLLSTLKLDRLDGSSYATGRILS